MIAHPNLRAQCVHGPRSPAIAQVRYTLAYYPSEAKPDGRFRTIQVGVKKTGLVATHRRDCVDASDLTCDASRAALLSKHGLAYNRRLDLNPATVRIKMVVRSVRTGAAGTVNLPVLK